MPSPQQFNAFTKVFHRVAIGRLAREPTLVKRALLTLERWHTQRGSSASDAYLHEWKILLQGDLDVLQKLVCADDDAAETLRNVSPMGFVLTPAERQTLRVQSAR